MSRRGIQPNPPQQPNLVSRRPPVLVLHDGGLPGGGDAADPHAALVPWQHHTVAGRAQVWRLGGSLTQVLATLPAARQSALFLQRSGDTVLSPAGWPTRTINVEDAMGLVSGMRHAHTKMQREGGREGGRKSARFLAIVTYPPTQPPGAVSRRCTYQSTLHSTPGQARGRIGRHLLVPGVGNEARLLAVAQGTWAGQALHDLEEGIGYVANSPQLPRLFRTWAVDLYPRSRWWQCPRMVAGKSAPLSDPAHWHVII